MIKRANLDGTSVEAVITGFGGRVAFILISPPGVTPSDAALKVVKTDAPNPVSTGTNLTYTLTVTNLSTAAAATNVQVKDKIPPGTTLVSSVATGGGSRSGTTDITCTFSSLGFGSSTTPTIVVSVNSTTTRPLTRWICDQQQHVQVGHDKTASAQHVGVGAGDTRRTAADIQWQDQARNLASESVTRILS